MKRRAPVLVWFRQDLRLSDNPALAAAVERGFSVIPVYVWAPEEEGAWPPGAASKWWLSRSLASLGAELEKRGSRLVVRRGPSAEALNRLVAENGASGVVWNRRYEPAAVARDSAVKSGLREKGLLAESFNGSLLFEPWTIRNQSGNPFRVFTAFWRTCLATRVGPAAPDAPKRLPSPEHWPDPLELADLKLAPSVDWAVGLRENWQPGEPGAKRELGRFLEEGLADYPVNRNRPDLKGTSRLSPHLHFGEIGPGQVWRSVIERTDGLVPSSQSFLRQIGWREFAHHLLFHNPESPVRPLRPQFSTFPWRMDSDLFKAWKRGGTGYPLVDAGMRELWRTGWMHNRVRMVVASFLVKHLLIGWQEGAAWFWDTLVDADLANNSLGWQWVAGCGADAAPYFRIFNPSVQAAKFDPDGSYVRLWVPELEQSPGFYRGNKYPPPIVKHEEARERALSALASIKND
jgi:deoxyribodipyrimidine photo-lyase